MTETPRYEVAPKIRDYLHAHPPGARMPTTSRDSGDLVALYNSLSARDRAIVYRVALSLAEHAAEYV